MKNPIQNTLFRFTTLRSPELIEPPIVDVKFVSEPEPLQSGIFYDAISNLPPGTTKAEALAAAAALFDAFKTKDEIRALNNGLYDFSEWLIRNRSTYTEAELQDHADSLTSLGGQVNGALQQVWNNLFFQVITQSSFYLKEALMQLLLADHVVRSLKSVPGEETEKFNKELVNARVTLPVVLFELPALPPDTEDLPVELSPAIPVKALKRGLAVTKAQFSTARSIVLKKELTRLEKKYRKEYKEAYDTALSAYNTSIAPLINNYNSAVEAVRQQFCNMNYDPNNKPYNPDDPCQQPAYVPMPSLPPFVFNFADEIDPAELKLNLTNESYTTLLDILGYTFDLPEPKSASQARPTPSQVIAQYDSYEEIYGQIDIVVKENNHAIIENTVPAQRQVSIGGIITPVTESTGLSPFEFIFSSVQSGLTSLYSLGIAVSEELEVLSIGVEQYDEGKRTETFTLRAPEASKTSGYLQLDGFFSYKFPETVVEEGPVFDFVLHFSDGSQGTISGIDSVEILNTSVKGRFTGIEPVSPHRPAPFVPLGFGIQQIGIADYLKVEQSIHCYLEGEVSHIENIMAREYKEKASRRLLRTEDTTTVSTETEIEQLTDTTSADRFEMQTEVGKVIQSSKDFSGSVNAGYNGGGTGFFVHAGASFANSSSREDSIRQAITEASEITERTLDRIITKVKEERVRKVIEEYEENNKHGFDNRRGSEHVVGVYRWVDKLYKNQIYNYGKRMMFEFMIPDPARLHLLGMEDELDSGTGTDLTPPVDPRTAPWNIRMEDYQSVTEDIAAHWAGMYNAELNAPLDAVMYVSGAFANDGSSGSYLKENQNDFAGGSSFSIDIPENYEAASLKGKFSFAFVYNRLENTHGIVNIGNSSTPILDQGRSTTNILIDDLGGIRSKLGVSFNGCDVGSFSISLEVKCRRTTESYTQWQQETFKAIMDAYYEALDEYNRKKAEEENKAVEIKETNPGFYRQIENIILRKNCISYLISRDKGALYTYGKGFGNGDPTFGGYEINLNSVLDEYTSFAKFIEQAFEWEIMSYNFYPFYWGPRESWKAKYTFNESDDHIFRSFIQAGLARVIVTVRPGFEEAVQLYMATGRIWNGGQVPGIGDPLYQSIIDEMKLPVGEKQGKAWTSRVPTSLTILQARSIGLEVETALPCNCDDLEDFENPDEVPCSDAFSLNNYKIGGDEGPEEPVGE